MGGGGGGSAGYFLQLIVSVLADVGEFSRATMGSSHDHIDTSLYDFKVC